MSHQVRMVYMVYMVFQSVLGKGVFIVMDGNTVLTMLTVLLEVPR